MRETLLMATVDDREAEATVILDDGGPTVVLVDEEGRQRRFDRVELQAAIGGPSAHALRSAA